MEKQYLTELRKFEALNAWIHFIGENPQLNLTFDQKEDKWHYVYGEFSLSISQKQFTENNKTVQKNIIFYVDFMESSLNITNAECFTKEGVKIGNISDEFIKTQNINAVGKEKDILLSHTSDIKKASKFDNDFKF